ncbi:MAG: flagellar basal body P-ring formation chaperone FlgA [Buchnera aphidicola (Meitanaphis microgallis)]
MILKVCIVLCLLFLVVFQIQADTLPEYLVNFIKKNNPIYSNNMDIMLYNYLPSKKWSTCSFPKFIPLNTFKSSELINIKIVCGHMHQFIQVKVRIRGEYIVASKNINKGQKITDQNISIKYGYLDHILLNTPFKKQQSLYLTNLKNSKKKCTLATKHSSQPTWLITANQKVSITIRGLGFIIMSEGQAMNHAFKNKPVKVKLDNGKVILGIANSHNNVIVNK